MKIKSIITAACILCAGYAFSQEGQEGKFTLFSEDGDLFTLFINGVQQNPTPAASVEVSKVKEVFLQLRVTFQDAAIPPIKKGLMRAAINTMYMITKNKKGEYTLKLKNAEGAFNNSFNTTTTTTTTTISSGGPLKATVNGDVINLSDGRSFSITKTNANWPDPHVVMKSPVGAKISITYDDGKNAYNSEVPFDYTVPDYTKNNVYFKLSVDEGGPDKTWYVRLQHGTGYILTIE